MAFIELNGHFIALDQLKMIQEHSDDASLEIETKTQIECSTKILGKLTESHRKQLTKAGFIPVGKYGYVRLDEVCVLDTNVNAGDRSHFNRLEGKVVVHSDGGNRAFDGNLAETAKHIKGAIEIKDGKYSTYLNPRKIIGIQQIEPNLFAMMDNGEEIYLGREDGKGTTMLRSILASVPMVEVSPTTMLVPTQIACVRPPRDDSSKSIIVVPGFISPFVSDKTPQEIHKLINKLRPTQAFTAKT